MQNAWESAERRAGWSQSEVALYNQTNELYNPLVCIYTAHLCLSVIHRPRHLAGSAVPECFSFDQYYIFNILNMIKIFNPNLSD